MGLAGGENTTLALTIGAGAERPSLILDVNVELPGSLAALKWTIRLSAASQRLLTSQLTMPLMRAQHKHMQEMTSLAHELKEKDHVIQKLLDKLEGQGVELGQVFPQVAGRAWRKGDRKKADERVKGLGVFNMDAWKNELPRKPAKDMAQLIQNVFPGDGEEHVRTDDNLVIPKEQETWWDNIHGITIGLDSGKISTSGIANANKARLKPKPAPEDSSDVDSGFQVQATPPRLLDTANHVLPKATADDSTEDDDDDLDAPSQGSKVPNSFPMSLPHVVSHYKPKNIRTIGGKKKPPKIAVAPVAEDESTADEDSPPLHRKKKGQPPTFTRVTASREESTEDEDLPPRMPTPRRKANPKALVPPEKNDESTEDDNHAPQRPTPRKKANLRALSPRKNGNESTEDGVSSSETSMFQKQPVLSTTDKSVVKPKNMLGRIGGKKSVPPPEPEHESEPEPGSPPRKTMPTPEITKPKKGKFTIGGKKKPTEPIAVTEQASMFSDIPSSAVTPEKKIIGHLGYERVLAAADKISVEEDEDQMRGRVPIRQKEEKVETRETSTERAHRKRQELKRELELKAQAPVKKKRRF